MVPTRPSQKKKYKSTENKYTASTTDVLIQHNTTVMSLLSLTAKEMSLLNNKASIQYTELTNSHIASVIETKLARGEVCIHGNYNSNSNTKIHWPPKAPPSTTGEPAMDYPLRRLQPQVLLPQRGAGSTSTVGAASGDS